MARPKTEVPQLRYHLSGQAFVRIDDRNYYLGKHGSPESFARYAVLIAEYRRNGLTLPTSFDLKSLNPLVESLASGTAAVPASTHQADEPILVKHLAEGHREWAKVRYAKNQAELQRARYICDELINHFGNLLAEKFGPRALKDQRARLVMLRCIEWFKILLGLARSPSHKNLFARTFFARHLLHSIFLPKSQVTCQDHL